MKITVKLIFGLAVFAFVGWKVYDIIQEKDFSRIELDESATGLLAVIFALMIVNWSIEALKWKVLMREVKPMSFIQALFGVLAGVSTGIITPNRLGNFIGRTIFLEKGLRLRGILLTLLANLSQFVVTVFFGSIGLLLIGVSFFEYSQLLLLPLALVILYFALRVFIHPRLVNRKPFNYFFSEQVEEGIDFISDTGLELKLRIIGLSALRYLVFVTQYVLLLMAFKQNQSWDLLFAHVMVVYLLMTLIPALFFGKLFVREAAALLVLSAAGVPDAVILLTGFVLWFVNIALPSLAGTSLLIGKK